MMKFYLICNHHHDTCDSMDSEMDRSGIIVRMEVSLESGHYKTDNVEPGSPNDGVNEVKKLFHCEVCEMGAKCFAELCFCCIRR